jgi:hypothetical protein
VAHDLSVGEMVGKDTVPEASVLRLVTRAGLEPPYGPSAKMARRAGRYVLTAHRRTRGPCRCTEASSPDVWVQRAERGKPAALSEAVQGVRPQSRPRASPGNGGAGKGRGSKRTPRCNGEERGARCAPRRKAADFPRGCPDEIAEANRTRRLCLPCVVSHDTRPQARPHGHGPASTGRHGTVGDGPCHGVASRRSRQGLGARASA